MSTPGLKALKRASPGCHVRFFSKFTPLVSGLPYIDEALPYEARPPSAIYQDYVDYDDFVMPRARLASLLADRLGIALTDDRPDCVIDPELVTRYHTAWRDLPRPYLVVLRKASGWTPNKNWPDHHWSVLLERLLAKATVIEIGEPDASGASGLGTNYHDLRGGTSLEELAAVVAAADIYVGPCSGPMHIAAAAGVRGVVIYGGYERASLSCYPGHIALTMQPPCSPCWLVTPCPYQLKCLEGIAPGTVEAAVWKAWAAAQPA